MAPSAVPMPSHTDLINSTNLQKRPHILVAAIPIFGHFDKLWNIAADLVSRGYTISFLSASVHRPKIEEIGASFVPLTGNADFDWEKRDELWPERNTIPAGPEQVVWDFKNLFIAPVPKQYECVQKFLAEAAAERPDEQVVIVQDICFWGTIPPVLGAPGLRPAGLITMGIAPVPMNSIDTAPFNMALPPDSSEEGRKRNIGLNQLLAQMFAPAQDAWNNVLIELKATEESEFLFNMITKDSDLFLQMCIKDIEYPRSDAPKTLRYIGALPSGWSENITYPEWWGEVVAHKKKIIVVSQGTASNNPEDLVIPTLEALKDRDDIMVVATIVRSDTIPDYEPPANARIAKFIPFDQLFPYANAVVSNGGYGTVQQALALGIPLVLAGITEDKPESCARAAWTGAAINLQTQKPEVEKIREAVGEVLAEDSSHKKRAEELMMEYKKYDCFGSIAAAVEELALRARAKEGGLPR